MGLGEGVDSGDGSVGEAVAAIDEVAEAVLEVLDPASG